MSYAILFLNVASPGDTPASKHSIVCRLFPFVTPIWHCTAGDWEGDGEHTDTQVMGSKVMGYIALACAALFACLVVFLRKQIALANGIIKVTNMISFL